MVIGVVCGAAPPPKPPKPRCRFRRSRRPRRRPAGGCGTCPSRSGSRGRAGRAGGSARSATCRRRGHRRSRCRTSMPNRPAPRKPPISPRPRPPPNRPGRCAPKPAPAPWLPKLGVVERWIGEMLGAVGVADGMEKVREPRLPNEPPPPRRASAEPDTTSAPARPSKTATTSERKILETRPEDMVGPWRAGKTPAPRICAASCPAANRMGRTDMARHVSMERVRRSATATRRPWEGGVSTARRASAGCGPRHSARRAARSGRTARPPARRSSSGAARPAVPPTAAAPQAVSGSVA